MIPQGNITITTSLLIFVDIQDILYVRLWKAACVCSNTMLLIMFESASVLT